MRALTELKKECMKRLDQYNIECYICDEFRPKRLLLHHLSYYDNSVTYNQFRNDDVGRLQYYSSLIDEVEYHNDNFRILCINCHTIVEELIKLPTHERQNFLHDRPRGLGFDRICEDTINAKKDRELEK